MKKEEALHEVGDRPPFAKTRAKVAGVGQVCEPRLQRVHVEPVVEAFEICSFLSFKESLIPCSPYDSTYKRSNRVARWYIYKPKNPNLCKFWRALELKMLVYFMAIWNILQP
jgi:hypothetical protein